MPAHCSTSLSGHGPRRQSMRKTVAPAVVGATAATSLAYSGVGFLLPSSGHVSSSSAMMSTAAKHSAEPRTISVSAHKMAMSTRTAQPAQQGLARPITVFGVAASLTAAAARRLQRFNRRTPQVGRRRGGDEGDLEETIESVVPFEIRGFSLAKLFAVFGFLLLGGSFLDYYLSFQGGGFGLGALTIIYAFPIVLLSFALIYAELEPVEIETEPSAESLFDAKATDTLKKIKKDVTRHRYGDDAHLDSSLKALGLVNKGAYPKLYKIVESKSPEGELRCTLLFDSRNVAFSAWSDPFKIKAFDRFFGPGLWSEVYKYDREKKIAALVLTTGVNPSESTEPGVGTASDLAPIPI